MQNLGGHHKDGETNSLRELSRAELDVVAGGGDPTAEAKAAAAKAKAYIEFNATLKELCHLGDALSCQML
jgi:hypothetical protein